MPFYRFECERCQISLEVFQRPSDLDRWGPPECEEHGPMQFVWEPRPHRPFPAFVTRHIDGKPVEITSLAQIRKLEKERQATGFCWEPGSYDSRYGSD